jgi:phosphoglycolate phosphatase-like HAD superfamily hydrolase
MLTDPKVMEAWFTLMAEAMKGTKEAQQAFQSLSKATLDPADLNRWMGTFMPGLASSAAPQQGEGPEQWLEDWWRMMGVVPRARYLELLEKYDTLTRRLEQARETIEKMRAALDDKARPEVKNVLDLWNTMLDETVKMQEQWARAWTQGNEQRDETAKKAGDDKGGKPS